MTFDIRVLNVVYILLLLSILYLPLFTNLSVSVFFYLLENPIYNFQARQSLRNGKEEEAERFSRNALLLILTTVFTLPILCFTAFVTWLDLLGVQTFRKYCLYDPVERSRVINPIVWQSIWLHVVENTLDLYVMKLRVYSIHSLCQCDGWYYPWFEYILLYTYMYI